jgi:hypothetical protein
MVPDGSDDHSPSSESASWGADDIAYVQDQVLRLIRGKSLVEVAEAIQAGMTAIHPSQGARMLLEFVLESLTK